MQNEFVTYEQALALKELGFDEHCFGYYADKTGEDKTIYTVSQVQGSINSMSVHFNSGCSSYQFSAPLKQQAFKFFREKYKLHSYIYADYSYNISGGIWDLNNYKDCKYDIDSESYSTYEEAEQACLDKLIEICKNKNNEQAN